MKEYKETVHIDGQVNEPAASYSASVSQETVIPGFSDEILNELLRQKESVKLMLIHKLAERYDGQSLCGEICRIRGNRKQGFDGS